VTAESEAVAGELLWHAFAAVSSPFSVDIPDRHAALGRWLTALGLLPERALIRMVYGRSAAFD